MTFKHSLNLVFLGLILLAGTGTAGAQLLEPEPEAAQGSYDRHDVPGHYTVGFYADKNGSSSELELPDGVDTFDAWVGITGDSTRVFSSTVMRMELPYGVEIAGPIVWVPRSGLKESGELLGLGMMVEFQYDCAQQKSPAPVMLGRLPLRMQPGVNDATLTPLPHTRSDSRWSSAVTPTPGPNPMPIRSRLPSGVNGASGID